MKKSKAVERVRSESRGEEPLLETVPDRKVRKKSWIKELTLIVRLDPLDLVGKAEGTPQVPLAGKFSRNKKVPSHGGP